MITVFLHLCFKMLRDLLRFIIDRAAKEWEHVCHRGRNFKNGDTERGDFYVEEIVENLTEERGNKNDPYVIDEAMYSFFRIPILAEAVHLETYINGLKSLHRADICAISGNANELGINASLGAGPLDFTSKLFVRLACIERLVTIKLSLNYCKVHTNFSIDARTGKNGKFQSVCIDQLSGVGFSIEGFGRWLCLPSLFVTLLMKLLKNLVRNIVEFILEQHLIRVLQSYQFPIEGTILDNTLVSEHTNDSDVEIIGELGPVLDDLDSTEIDTGSFYEHLQTFYSKNIPSNNTTKSRKPIWCTNLPWFEDIVEEQGICNDEFDDSDISIQFQFSKDNVIQEDIEPLTSSERPTCCVFFRSEVGKFCNDTSELYENIAGYGYLTNEKQRQNSRSKAHSLEDCSPVKYCNDFLGLVTKGESPVVPGGSKLPVSEETTVPCNLEAHEKEIDGLMQRFFLDYPHFVAFTHSEETDETGNSNEKCAIDVDIEMPTDSNNKVYATSDDERDYGFKEVGSQNKSNPMGINTLSDNAAEFTEAKYLELCELKTAYAKETVGFSNLYKDDFNLENSSLTCEVLRFNEDHKQNIGQNFKHLENEDYINQSEYLPAVSNSSVNVVKTRKDFNQIEHVESILKWDDENIDEMYTLKSDNIEATRKMSSQNSVSSLISDFFNRTQLSKDTLVKTDECSDSGKAVMSLKFPPGLREENNNAIESSTKYNTLITVERINTTGESVFRCFDDPYDSRIPPASFYFHDRETTNFSKLLESDLNISLFKDGLKQNIEGKMTNYVDGIQNDIRDIRNIMHVRQEDQIRDVVAAVQNLKRSCDSAFDGSFNILSKEKLKEMEINLVNEKFERYPLESLNEGNNQTKDSEREDTLTGKGELKSEICNTGTEFIDVTTDNDYYDPLWLSDDQSDDVSSDSDKEEDDVGNSVLCKEFEYKTNCMESETKLVDPATGVENMERRSSEESLLNSSPLNTETINLSIDSLNDSNGEIISQEALINTRDVDIKTDVNIDTQKTDIDSPAKLDEESTDSYSLEEIIACSIERSPECTTTFRLKEPSSFLQNEYNTDCLKITESDDMDARTSKDQSSLEHCNYTTYEDYYPPSLLVDCCPNRPSEFALIEGQDMASELMNVQKKILSRIHTSESNDPSIEERRIFGSNESIEDFSNVTKNVDILNIVNETKTALLREARYKLDLINSVIGCTTVSEESSHELCAKLLPLLTENTLNSGLCLEGNQDCSKENELVSINSFEKCEVDHAVAKCDIDCNIDSPEHLNAETSYNCLRDNAKLEFNEGENVCILPEDEMKEFIQILKDKMVSKGFNESSISLVEQDNVERTFDGSPETIEICLDENVLPKDIKLELENTKNEPEQVDSDVDSDVTIINDPLEKQDQTPICGENSIESTESTSCFECVEEMESIQKQCTDEETEHVSLE